MWVCSSSVARLDHKDIYKQIDFVSVASWRRTEPNVLDETLNITRRPRAEDITTGIGSKAAQSIRSIVQFPISAFKLVLSLFCILDRIQISQTV